MGIYLPNMEMPTAGMCKTITIFDDGAVVEGNGSEKLGIAVPVPPHGRLVDARYIRDAIIQKWMDKAGNSHMYKCGMEDAYEVIRNAPTIIPADTVLENEIHIIDTKGKSNYDPKRRFVISSPTIITEEKE